MEGILLFLAAYFAFGTMWFWLLLTGSVILGLLCAAKEAPISFTLVILATAAVIFGANGIQPVLFVQENWMWLVGALVLYLPLGVIFTSARWHAYATSRRDLYNQYKIDFLSSRKVEVAGKKATELRIPDDQLKNWTEYLSRRSSTLYPKGEQQISTINPSPKDLIPAITEHKARVTSWLLYWPWFAVWHLIKDSVDWVVKNLKKAVDRIYYSLRSWFQSIANRAFEGVDDDFREVTPPETPASHAPGSATNGSGVSGTDSNGSSQGRSGLRDTVQ